MKFADKISSYVLYACIAVIAVVLVLFYCVGFNNQEGGLTTPAHTDTLFYLMYALFAIAVVVALVAAVARFIANIKGNPKAAIRSIVGIILLVALVVVTYSMGSTNPVETNGVPYTDAFWLKTTDMWLYSTYVLLVIAIIATAINMIGVVKKLNFK